MATITEDYVSFETAKLLKEKGFDIPCDNCYDSLGKTPNESVYGVSNIETLDYNADPFVKSGFPKFKTFSAPTQSMAMKWLREVHNIYISIQPDFPSDKDYKMCWCCSVDILHEDCISTKWYQCYIETYEEACEAAILYCLINLI